MGLITRCPACGTMFKVVADQLRISEGWVRCGHCAEIFDATADLRDESRLELPGTAERQGSAAEAATVAVAAPAAAAQPRPSEYPTSEYPGSEYPGSEYPSSVHSEVGDSALQGSPDPVEIEEEARVLREDPLDQPFELRRADAGDVEQAGPHGFSRPMPLEPEPQAELEDLSFVRQARRREFWRRPLVRAMLFLALLALLAALAAQVAFQDRDRLAAAYPQLRPALARMCDALGCRIGPPRLIDSVGIETSSFNKLRGDTYRLNVTLRNQAAIPVAMPALELTLTDAQDQPVLRRVIQPGEFAGAAASLAAAADWSTTVGVTLHAGAAGSRIAGYRLLAFYP